VATEIPIESVTIGDTTYERWAARWPKPDLGETAQWVEGSPVISGFSPDYADRALAGRSFYRCYGLTPDEFRGVIARSQRRIEVYAQAEAILAGERGGFDVWA
jgi:hypothetical protein